MTAKEMAKILGKVAMITRSVSGYGMTFDVRIVDVKDDGWGRTLFEIEPVAGGGCAWVNSEEVKIHDA
jgi:hypothetical protein